MKRSLFIVTLLLAVAACDKGGPDAPPDPAKPIELTTRGAEKVAADNDFAFRFFRETVATAPDDKKVNAFVSPLSMTMALGMLYNGCSAEAAAEMATALGVGDFSADEFNAHYKNLGEALLAVDPLTALAIANSIWTRTGFPVKPAFHDVNRTWYGAEALSRDFSLQATVDEINRWCADKTNGRIPSILSGPISADVVMYLINAVYFKGQWKYQFDKSATRQEPFTLADGSSKDVPMMQMDETTLPCYADERVQAIDLPYGNGAFSMMIVLPEAGVTLDELAASLDGETYGEIVDGLRETKVRVAIPRWKQECEFPLMDATKNLDIRQIFGEGSLTGINDDPRLCVGEIRQKSFVEVNEEGTEAAAVTIVGVEETSVGPSFRADRPFLYLIRERSTGAILFVGRMDNPA
jgi:serpin B